MKNDCRINSADLFGVGSVCFRSHEAGESASLRPLQILLHRKNCLRVFAFASRVSLRVFFLVSRNWQFKDSDFCLALGCVFVAKVQTVFSCSASQK